jgi:hypothetical protein
LSVLIVPHDKDWTWVLERLCPECGFDASSVRPESAGHVRDVCMLNRIRLLLMRREEDPLFPNGDQDARRSRSAVASFGRHMIHDPVHHLYDVSGHRGSATPT